MNIQKKTWCPKCNGSLERFERTVCSGNTWVKKFFVIYRCDTCDYKNETDLLLSKKYKRRLQKKLKGVSFNG